MPFVLFLVDSFLVTLDLPLTSSSPTSSGKKIKPFFFSISSLPPRLVLCFSVGFVHVTFIYTYQALSDQGTLFSNFDFFYIHFQWSGIVADRAGNRGCTGSSFFFFSFPPFCFFSFCSMDSTPPWIF